MKEAKKYLDRLDEKNPDDESVIDQKVRLLRHDSLTKAAGYAQEKIKAGCALPILAYIDLQPRKKTSRPCNQDARVGQEGVSRSSCVCAITRELANCKIRWLPRHSCNTAVNINRI